jgi:hypothetical protein
MDYLVEAERVERGVAEAIKMVTSWDLKNSSKTPTLGNSMRLPFGYQLLIVLSLCSPFMTGCKAKPQESQPTHQADDPSLGVSQYVEFGFPSLDRDWNEEDHLAAARSIEQMSRNNPTALPRFNSSKSGRLFDRIANGDVLFQLRDKDVPFERRDRVRKYHATALAATLKAYSRSREYERGIARLIGASLHLHILVGDFYDEAIAKLPADDKRLIEIGSLKRGETKDIEAVLGFVLDSFAEGLQLQMDPENILDLIMIIRDPFQTLFKRASKDTQQFIRDRIDRILESTVFEGIHEKLRQLRNELAAKQ